MKIRTPRCPMCGGRLQEKGTKEAKDSLNLYDRGKKAVIQLGRSDDGYECSSCGEEYSVCPSVGRRFSDSTDHRHFCSCGTEWHTPVVPIHLAGTKLQIKVEA